MLLIPEISEDGDKEKQEVSAGDMLSMKFVKSALTVNPCMVSRFIVEIDPFETFLLSNS